MQTYIAFSKEFLKECSKIQAKCLFKRFECLNYFQKRKDIKDLYNI